MTITYSNTVKRSPSDARLNISPNPPISIKPTIITVVSPATITPA